MTGFGNANPVQFLKPKTTMTQLEKEQEDDTKKAQRKLRKKKK